MDVFGRYTGISLSVCPSMCVSVYKILVSVKAYSVKSDLDLHYPLKLLVLLSVRKELSPFFKQSIIYLCTL